jgi:hypothetical protein
MHDKKSALMIDSFEISNFRCFETLKVENCRRINVIVGESGAGKTAMLEGLFLALGASPEIAVRYRAQRGMDLTFGGTMGRIDEAIWRDLFYHGKWDTPATIELHASGADNRKVSISKTNAPVEFPMSRGAPELRVSSVVFDYVSAEGVSYRRVPKMAGNSILFEGEQEDLPDHFYMAAHLPTGSVENASRFSDLDKEGRSEQFLTVLTKEYPWIHSLSVQVEAGQPIVHAKIRGSQRSLPLALVSGGLNRTLSMYLIMASRNKSVLLVDEIEGGVYYKHMASFWRSFLEFSRSYNSQVFVTTHSNECLKALATQMRPERDDVALWRLERTVDGKPILYQFSGMELKLGLENDAEVRGGVEH